MYIDEDFEINLIRLKFLSLLLTGRCQKGEVSKIIRKRCISRLSKVVHNVKPPLTCP